MVRERLFGIGEAPEHLASGLSDAVCDLKNLLARCGERGSTASVSADQLLNQLSASQILKRFKRLPGRFVRDARCTGGFRNRAGFLDTAKDIDPLIG